MPKAQAWREPDRDPESEIENKKPIENRGEKLSRFSESDFDFEKQIEYLRKLLGRLQEKLVGKSRTIRKCGGSCARICVMHMRIHAYIIAIG